jgi:hypothetical protein
VSVSSLSIEVGTSELTATFTFKDIALSDNRHWSLFVACLHMQLRLAINNVFVRYEAWRGTEGTVTSTFFNVENLVLTVVY